MAASDDPMEVDDVKQEQQDDISDIDPAELAERRAALDKLREEQNALIASDKQEAAKKRLAFIQKHTEILLHFKPSTGEYSEEKKSGARRRKTEKEEDEELLKDGGHAAPSELRLTSQPTIMQGGQLRDYQLEGLNWLVHLYANGISGILADEMGLGKTIQSISMLAYLKEYKGHTGPFIVITPKSTLSNWMGEFKKWCPSIRPIKFHGSKEERERMKEEDVVQGKFDVVVTTYEVVNTEKAHLKKFHWRYLIIDEAHRIKNENSMLAQSVRVFNCHARLLLTGTPLQNNLHELWALLNFLLPEEFDSSDDFDAFFQATDEDTQTVTEKLHKILRPFLLRRLKSDVEKGLPPKKEINLYIPLSTMQKKLYSNLLKKDIDAINGQGGNQVRLLNIVMQLRKCCNHPYLFEGQEPGPPFIEGEHLVTNSGKLIALDKLLAKLKGQGSRVLIFSQMTRVLDILEDYSRYRGYEYCRIDGSITGDVRDNAIESFNKPDSDKFIFLLSTRAGGLGINLQTADQVVLFDSDWNPQADIQAMDRAHRIGQKKPVFVYRFITEGAIEEKIVERAFKKLFLDAMVIQQGRLMEKNKSASKTELLEMIRFGADEVIRLGDIENSEFDIEDVLASGIKKTEELTATLKEAVGKSFMANFAMDGAQNNEDLYQFDGEDHKKGKKDQYFLDIGARQRTTSNYNVDQAFRDQNRSGPVVKTGPKLPKHLQLPTIHDFQFFDTDRLKELAEKKKAHWTFLQSLTEEEREKLGDEQSALAENNGLSEQEKKEEEAILQNGFGNWSKKEFTGFKNACERYGRNEFAEIARDIGTKSEEEVKQYSEVFWSKISTLQDSASIVSKIEKGEQKIQKRKDMMDAVARKVAKHPNPWQTLKIQYGTSKGKAFTEEEDRFIICMTNKLGFGRWDELKCEIRKAWNFRFDWYIKSRRPGELQNRFETLVRQIQKEFDNDTKKGEKKKGAIGGGKRKADDSSPMPGKKGKVATA